RTPSKTLLPMKAPALRPCRTHWSQGITLPFIHAYLGAVLAMLVPPWMEASVPGGGGRMKAARCRGGRRPCADKRRARAARLISRREMPTAEAASGTVPPKPAVSAVEMGARQREISVSEFFTKNRHLL